MKVKIYQACILAEAIFSMVTIIRGKKEFNDLDGFIFGFGLGIGNKIYRLFFLLFIFNFKIYSGYCQSQGVSGVICFWFFF